MKRIFFAALLATLAVGGAISAQATFYYASGSNTPADCLPIGYITCSSVVGSDFLYLFPADHEGGQGEPQDVSDMFVSLY